MFQYSMLRSPHTSDGHRAARILTLLLGLTAMVLVAFNVAGAAQADAKSAQRIELGARNMATLKPNCGKDFTRDCKIEGKVTAFQSLTPRYEGRNFVVPFDGKLVAWSISLAQPTRADIGDNFAQLPFANEIFGSPSQAGISILRQVEKRKKGAPRYKLVRRGPVEILNPYFGTKVTFALNTPLNVYKDNVVALTIPTWVPALWTPKACNRTIYGDLIPDRCERARDTFTWRGSRVPREKTCELGTEGAGLEQLEKTRPQTRVDSVRGYGCYYGGNVLLYSATIVGP